MQLGLKGEESLPVFAYRWLAFADDSTVPESGLFCFCGGDGGSGFVFRENFFPALTFLAFEFAFELQYFLLELFLFEVDFNDHGALGVAHLNIPPYATSYRSNSSQLPDPHIYNYSDNSSLFLLDFSMSFSMSTSTNSIPSDFLDLSVPLVLVGPLLSTYGLSSSSSAQ